MQYNLPLCAVASAKFQSAWEESHHLTLIPPEILVACLCPTYPMVGLIPFRFL